MVTTEEKTNKELSGKALKRKICENLEPEEIKDLRQQLLEKQQELEELDDWEMDECDVNDYLDDCYPEVDLAGVKYSFSRVLKDVDDCRYDEFKTDIENQQREEKEEELQDEIEDIETELEELIGEEDEDEKEE